MGAVVRGGVLCKKFEIRNSGVAVGIETVYYGLTL
jgi:hypothetical protein